VFFTARLGFFGANCNASDSPESSCDVLGWNFTKHLAEPCKNLQPGCFFSWGWTKTRQAKKRSLRSLFFQATNKSMMSSHTTSCWMGSQSTWPKRFPKCHELAAYEGRFFGTLWWLLNRYIRLAIFWWFETMENLRSPRSLWSLFHCVTQNSTTNPPKTRCVFLWVLVAFL